MVQQGSFPTRILQAGLVFQSNDYSSRIWETAEQVDLP